MMTKHRVLRVRREFDNGFKSEAVRMVQVQGLSIGDVCRSMYLGETAVRRWVKQYNTQPN